jgi:hypothetical protein
MATDLIIHTHTHTHTTPHTHIQNWIYKKKLPFGLSYDDPVSCHTSVRAETREQTGHKTDTTPRIFEGLLQLRYNCKRGRGRRALTCCFSHLLTQQHLEENKPKQIVDDGRDKWFDRNSKRISYEICRHVVFDTATTARIFLRCGSRCTYFNRSAVGDSSSIK